MFLHAAQIELKPRDVVDQHTANYTTPTAKFSMSLNDIFNLRMYSALLGKTVLTKIKLEN